MDLRLAREALGDHGARLATEEELQQAFADCELGALPPLGSLLSVPAYVDPEIMEHDTVIFAAASQTESVKGDPADLFRDEQVQVVPLTRPPHDYAE